MLKNEDLEAVKRMTLFQRLNPDDLSLVISSCAVRRYEKGAEIFQQGDASPHFFGVLDGWVKVHRLTNSGEQALLGLFGKGETFAEAAMFLGHTYPASAEAAETSRLCLFSTEAFEKAAARSPTVLFGMLGAISQHLHEMTLQVEQLKTRNARQRIGLFLLRMSGGSHGSRTIELPYDKALLAGRLGMTPESLSRNIAALKTIGVSVAGQRVTVEDCNRLAQFCTTTPLRQRPD